MLPRLSHASFGTIAYPSFVATPPPSHARARAHVPRAALHALLNQSTRVRSTPRPVGQEPTSSKRHPVTEGRVGRGWRTPARLLIVRSQGVPLPCAATSLRVSPCSPPATNVCSWTYALGHTGLVSTLLKSKVCACQRYGWGGDQSGATSRSPPRCTGARQDPRQTLESLVSGARARAHTAGPSLNPTPPGCVSDGGAPQSPVTRRYHAPSPTIGAVSRGPPAAPHAPCPSAVITWGNSSGEGSGGCTRTKGMCLRLFGGVLSERAQGSVLAGLHTSSLGTSSSARRVGAAASCASGDQQVAPWRCTRGGIVPMQIGLVAYSTKGTPDEGSSNSIPQRASSARHRPAHPRRERDPAANPRLLRARACKGRHGASRECSIALPWGGEERKCCRAHVRVRSPLRSHPVTRLSGWSERAG